MPFAKSLHTRTRLAGQSDGDVSSTLQHYDRAISALDAAKAEYELGVALQRRAQLHKRTGRLDEAHADAVTARRCFAAVGAAVEREEMERGVTAPG